MFLLYQVKMLYTCDMPVYLFYVIIWHGKTFDFLHFEPCQFEKTIIIIITIIKNLSTSYPQVINKVINIINNFNNHHTKLSTLYINLSTLQYKVIHTITHSFQYYIYFSLCSAGTNSTCNS